MKALLLFYLIFLSFSINKFYSFFFFLSNCKVYFTDLEDDAEKAMGQIYDKK